MDSTKRARRGSDRSAATTSDRRPPRTRIAIIADTHGYIDTRIVDVVRSCDIAVHAGDVGGREVLQALCPRSGRVYAVSGNNDTPVKWRRSLPSLPDHVRLALPGGTLVAVHGDRVLPAARRHERLRRLYPHARVIVYGHTHRLACDQSELPWVLNPGAAGRARTFGGPSCLTLDVGARAWCIRAVRFNGAAR